MENLNVENKMYQMAIELITKRYPVGWGGVAVIHTAKDNFLLVLHSIQLMEVHSYVLKLVLCARHINITKK